MSAGAADDADAANDADAVKAGDDDEDDTQRLIPPDERAAKTSNKFVYYIATFIIFSLLVASLVFFSFDLTAQFSSFSFVFENAGQSQAQNTVAYSLYSVFVTPGAFAIGIYLGFFFSLWYSNQWGHSMNYPSALFLVVSLLLGVAGYIWHIVIYHYVYDAVLASNSSGFFSSYKAPDFSSTDSILSAETFRYLFYASTPVVDSVMIYNLVQMLICIALIFPVIAFVYLLRGKEVAERPKWRPDSKVLGSSAATIAIYVFSIGLLPISIFGNCVSGVVALYMNSDREVIDFRWAVFQIPAALICGWHVFMFVGDSWITYKSPLKKTKTANDGGGDDAAGAIKKAYVIIPAAVNVLFNAAALVFIFIYVLRLSQNQDDCKSLAMAPDIDRLTCYYALHTRVSWAWNAQIIFTSIATASCIAIFGLSIGLLILLIMRLSDTAKGRVQ